MHSLSRIFKHSKDKDKDKEKDHHKDRDHPPQPPPPPVPTSSATTAETKHTSPKDRDRERDTPYAAAFSKKKDKKESPQDIARKEERERLRFQHLKRLAEIENDAWLRTEVEPAHVVELISAVSKEVKTRALDIPFLLLPFRPTATHGDLTSARLFIRHYFKPPPERPIPLRGDTLNQEVRLVDPPVLCSLLKWCWARLKGGVVGWEVYNLFKIGEQDSDHARSAFTTFIPLAVDPIRTRIITDFFDLLASIAAHSKSNGLAGRKLSRFAAWWAFEHADTPAYIAATSLVSPVNVPPPAFLSSYRNWEEAADATSHLFFAYLRSLTPDPNLTTIQTVPTSLRDLERATEYPPTTPRTLRKTTLRVVLLVNRPSPTPFALVRRANAVDYEAEEAKMDDRAAALLTRFGELENPALGLTEECVRLLKGISKAGHSHAADTSPFSGFGSPAHGAAAGASAFIEPDTTTNSPALGAETAASDDDAAEDDASSTTSTHLHLFSRTGNQHTWSRFEDIGFDGGFGFSDTRTMRSAPEDSRRSTALDRDRPPTPSWADFLSSGFGDSEGLKGEHTALQLPHDNVLPPLAIQADNGGAGGTGGGGLEAGGLPVRGKSSQSHVRRRKSFDTMARDQPGQRVQVAGVSTLDLDDSFFWVWIASLAPEETCARRSLFGRVALLETNLKADDHDNDHDHDHAFTSDKTIAHGEGEWFVFEEQLRNPPPTTTAADADEHAAAAAAAAAVERKGTLFGLRNKLTKSSRRRSALGPGSPTGNVKGASVSANAVSEFGGLVGQTTGAGAGGEELWRPSMAVSISPEQHARMQAAALALQRGKREREAESARREGGKGDSKGSSPGGGGGSGQLRLDKRQTRGGQPERESVAVLSEVSEAMKWASLYDRSQSQGQGQGQQRSASAAPPAVKRKVDTGAANANANANANAVPVAVQRSVSSPIKVRSLLDVAPAMPAPSAGGPARAATQTVRERDENTGVQERERPSAPVSSQRAPLGSHPPSPPLAARSVSSSVTPTVSNTTVTPTSNANANAPNTATTTTTTTPDKPASIAPSTSTASTSTTTTTTMRSIIATNAELSETTPKAARLRPEPVKIPPPVLSSPTEPPPASARDFAMPPTPVHIKHPGAAATAAVSSLEDTPMTEREKAEVPVIQGPKKLKKKSTDALKGMLNVKAPQKQQPQGDAPSAAPRPRPSAELARSVSPAGGGGGGVVAAKRAALEKMNAAARSGSSSGTAAGSPPTTASAAAPVGVSVLERKRTMQLSSSPPSSDENANANASAGAGAGTRQPSPRHRPAPLTLSAQTQAGTGGNGEASPRPAASPSETSNAGASGIRGPVLSPPLRIRTSESRSPTRFSADMASDAAAMSPEDRWAQIRRNAAAVTSGSPSSSSSPAREGFVSKRNSWNLSAFGGQGETGRSSVDSARGTTAPTRIKRVSVPSAGAVVAEEGKGEGGEKEKKEGKEGKENVNVKENVRPTSGGSETSREESIEDRVARIKARVAQLTGMTEEAAQQTQTQTQSQG